MDVVVSVEGSFLGALRLREGDALDRVLMVELTVTSFVIAIVLGDRRRGSPTRLFKPQWRGLQRPGRLYDQ